jgi:Phosphoesterase family
MWRTFGRGGAALLLVALLTLPAGAADAPSWPSTLPRYDHIVIVVEENKDYDQIIGNIAAPYLNKLASEGASLAQMFAEEHPSEGNYFWLFSGGNQDVGFFDQVPRAKFTASNLGEQLIKKGLSFKGYSQSLPAIGSEVDVTPPSCTYPCVYYSNGELDIVGKFAVDSLLGGLGFEPRLAESESAVLLTWTSGRPSRSSVESTN